MRIATAACAGSTARQPSIPALIRRIPSRLSRGRAGGEHPAGPYRMPAYRCRTFSVATNKCPILPYRGVARTGVCFALEIMLDAVAVEAGIEPGEVRLRNLVSPDEMPFDNITNKHSTAATTRKPCGARWRRSISRPCGRVSARKNGRR